MRRDMNYYEVLGVPSDATQEEVRHAYLAKTEQLRPERFAGAPPEVVDAVNRASVVVESAWHLLGDVALRAHYDSDLNSSKPPDMEDHQRRGSWRRRHAEHVWEMERALGLPLSSVLGMHPSSTDADLARDSTVQAGDGLRTGMGSPSEQWGLSPLYDPLASLERVADWLAPRPRAGRDVVVPNVCGLHGSDVWYAVAKADLHINCVRLSEHPTGDGIVVDQDPASGTLVRRFSTLTIQVVYPSPDAAPDDSLA
jgi:hypothetical protein